MNYPEELLLLFDELIAYCQKVSKINGILLVGSYATGDFTETSDIDLVILSDSPSELFEHTEWANQFGIVQDKHVVKFGSIQALKVKYTDKEVDYAITSPRDIKIESIIKKGAKIIYDPQKYFFNLLENINQ